MNIGLSRKCEYIYIPVEIMHREFLAKLLFACFVVKRGYQVIIGRHTDIYNKILPFYPRGIVVEHSVQSTQKPFFDVLERLGHTIVAWDEEALAQPSSSWYLARRVPELVLKKVHSFFVWGKLDYKWLKEGRPSQQSLYKMVGNPRLDILRKEFNSIFYKKGREYRAKHGDFILINSNFNRVNFLKEQKNTFLDNVSKAANLTLDKRVFLENMLALQEENFKQYCKMIPLLAKKFNNYKIIIRPHPAENREPWDNIANKIDNVEVIYEGTANDWSAGSRLLIHSGCTTAIEANILGVNCIEYMPVNGEESQYELTRAASALITNEGELFDAVKRALTNTKKEVDLVKYFPSLSGQFSSDQILDDLDNIRVNFSFLSCLYRWYRILHRFLNPQKYNKRNNSQYELHKFPDINLDNLHEIINELTLNSEYIKAPQVKELNQNCFLMN